jgi:protease I
VLDMVRHFAESGKPVASICHGAQILAAAGVVQRRRLNCYPAVAPEVTRAGAEYVELPWEGVLVDDNLVSAPAWTAHPAWLAKFLELLGTRIEP